MKHLTKIPTAKELLSLAQYDIEAVLFDMDGTLLNTEDLHFKCILEFLPKELEINDFFKSLSVTTLSEIKAIFEGRNDAFVFDVIQKVIIEKGIVPQTYWPTTSDEFIIRKNQQIISHSFEDIKGALWPSMINLLKELKELGLKLAVVTASQRAVLDFFMDELSLRDSFDFLVAREDTVKTKPDPDPYSLALDILASGKESDKEVEKGRILVLEDSEVGLLSARACGLDPFKVSWFSKDRYSLSL